MLKEYYQERGWDVETGIPFLEKVNYHRLKAGGLECD